MKKDISIEDLAYRIHSTALEIQPDKLSELLCLLDTDDEKKMIIRYLEERNTFHYVSILDSALRDYGQWSDPLMIQKRRSDNKRQIALFNHYLDVCLTIGVPTSMLEDIFKADDDETDDEVLEEPKAELLLKGFRDIDIDLYIASRRLDFNRVEDLLSKGADPEVCVNGIDTAANLAHTEVECNLDIVYPILTGESKLNNWSEEHILISYAAYDMLLYKFKMYEDKKMKSDIIDVI